MDKKKMKEDFSYEQHGELFQGIGGIDGVWMDGVWMMDRWMEHGWMHEVWMDGWTDG